MAKQWIGFVGRIFISLLLLGLLFTRVNIDELANHIQNMNPLFFMLAVVLFICYLCIWALRWQILINDTGLDVPYINTLRTLLTGLTVSLFLPSAVGADVGRAYDMARDRVEKVKILSTVMMDRLLGLIAIIGMAIIAIGIAGYKYLTTDIFLAVVGVGLALIIGWIFFFNILFMRKFRSIIDSIPIVNQFTEKIRDIYFSLYYLQLNRKLFTKAVVISILTVSLEIISVISLSYALGDKIELVFFFLFMPIVWVILIIPIAIGGLGLREAVFAFFFTQVGMTTTHAVTLSLLYYSLYAVTGVISGMLLIINNLCRKNKTSKQHTAAISSNM